MLGSRIALFGCPSAAALENLGKIELAEGLPHPLLDGVWGKVSPEATASYLIIDFGGDNLDQALRLTRQAGLRQISFDGLEGNCSTGMGQYGRTLFTQAWYDRLAPALRGQVINDASNPGHFTWHIYTRMNWGEPWYAGFRASQTPYRLQNQKYYRRNLMPSMLGWFQMGRDQPGRRGVVAGPGGGIRRGFLPGHESRNRAQEWGGGNDPQGDPTMGSGADGGRLSRKRQALAPGYPAGIPS